MFFFFFFFFVSESGSCCYAHAFGRSPFPHWKQHLCFKGLLFIHGHPCHACLYQLDLVLGLPRLNCGEWHSVGSPNANFSWSCTEKAHLDPPRSCPARHGSCSATLVSFENSFSSRQWAHDMWRWGARVDRNPCNLQCFLAPWHSTGFCTNIAHDRPT